MNKESKYNIAVQYNDEVLLYNTLSNAVCRLSAEEFDTVTELLNNTDLFEKEYPDVFSQMKKDGYIVDADFNELEYIRFQNRMQIFGDRRLHITINPTLDCNLTCWYCSTEYAKASHNGRMSDETVDAIKRHIRYQITEAKIPALHLDWFGGEPLMFFDEVIYPIASFAKELCDKHGVILTQHATTNAVLMTSEMMDKMNQLGFTSFQIPIDGNELHHNSIKFTSNKEGTFRTVLAHVNALVERLPNVHIILRINYDRKTLYGISDIIPLISEKAKQHIMVDFQKVWQVQCNDKDKEQLSNMKKLFSENGLNSEYWAYRPHQFYRCYSDKLHHYAINYDGRIFKCTAQDYGDDKSIGKLNGDGTLSLKQGLLSQLLSRATFENGRCINCKKLPLCMGRCMIRNHEARTQRIDLPCMSENAQYPFESHVIEVARKRGLI